MCEPELIMKLFIFCVIAYLALFTASLKTKAESLACHTCISQEQLTVLLFRNKGDVVSINPVLTSVGNHYAVGLNLISRASILKEAGHLMTLTEFPIP
jgi:hypothetical protein